MWNPHGGMWSRGFDLEPKGADAFVQTLDGNLCALGRALGDTLGEDVALTGAHLSVQPLNRLAHRFGAETLCCGLLVHFGIEPLTSATLIIRRSLVGSDDMLEAEMLNLAPALGLAGGTLAKVNDMQAVVASAALAMMGECDPIAVLMAEYEDDHQRGVGTLLLLLDPNGWAKHHPTFQKQVAA